ncbi:TPA: phosphocholine cytidylyltransferase family protein [Streptococcus suis]|uniref:Choline-phosphate cytidylyltransferase n=1 Tax=Streptococcus suis TaxID=1307 RepID=A0A0A7M4C6_STRSU|nr:MULTISPECIES: phosphocholine cytidylyltransferase family protein [Streptococcus]AIZ73047.1 Cps31O [Streptococcus suis]AWX95203.1 choline-phosphate cytidylyltransferase [Streptococcus suis]AWX97152.1 choline-phosphate cytidylyltransferase [Streptococcus suis]MBL6439042.1 phosphocholine cytidylyltransferase family protein [Streptococcus suis]MBM7136541.1 phosphocholine cytidylyltransferase family protein [Streptococcus suis]
MKIILLAAGRGTRISRYIQDRPKCTVNLTEKQTLIEYTVSMFNRYGFDDISIILGYRQDVIREVLKDYNVKFYYNPFYDVTNSIASLWFAREELNDDLFIMNADVFLDTKTLDKILSEKKSPVLFSDESRKEEADYKFYYEAEKLIKYGKELSVEETTGEYIGAAIINKEFLPKFNRTLLNKINHQEHGQWWEEILYSMTRDESIYVSSVTGNFWAEVDYIEDYENIISFVKNNSI